MGSVEKCLQEDGSLFNLGWYLSWGKGEDFCTLDGTFNSQDLRNIADYMDGKK